MKVVIICPFYNSLNRGIERYTNSIAKEFGEQAIECVIYSWASNNKINWGYNLTNIKIREVPNFKYFKSFFAIFYYWIWLVFDKPNSIILNFLYHGERFLPKFLKYVYVLHSPADQIPNRYDYIKKYIKKYKNIQFVAVSNYVKELALPYITNKKISVIYNGVDLNKFVPKKNNNFKSERFIRIVTFSALEERKGMQYMIKALGERSNRDFIYHIYGDGPYKKTLIEIIKFFNLEDNVFIFNPIQNVESKMLDYDIFCLLSKGEAFPLAPLEAIACGIPVLTSNHRPYDEFIIDRIGLMVSVQDSNQINCSIDILYFNKKSFVNTSYIQKYSWNSISKKYLEIIS